MIDSNKLILNTSDIKDLFSYSESSCSKDVADFLELLHDSTGDSGPHNLLLKIDSTDPKSILFAPHSKTLHSNDQERIQNPTVLNFESQKSDFASDKPIEEEATNVECSDNCALIKDYVEDNIAMVWMNSEYKPEIDTDLVRSEEQSLLSDYEKGAGQHIPSNIRDNAAFELNPSKELKNGLSEDEYEEGLHSGSKTIDQENVFDSHVTPNDAPSSDTDQSTKKIVSSSIRINEMQQKLGLGHSLVKETMQEPLLNGEVQFAESLSKHEIAQEYSVSRLLLEMEAKKETEVSLRDNVSFPGANIEAALQSALVLMPHELTKPLLPENIQLTPKIVSETVSIPIDINNETWSKHFSEYIIWFGQQGVKSAVIKINPEELGPLEISVNVLKDNASLNITIDNHYVRDIIEQSLPRLQAMMLEQGLNLHEVHIDSESDSRQFAQNQNSSPEELNHSREDELSETPLKDKKKIIKGLVDYFA